MRLSEFLERADDAIAARPGTVVVAFLVATLVFGAGLGGVSTASGTEQFAEDIPAARALEDINREFGPSFDRPTGSTQLIQKGDNVLSKAELLRMLRAQHRLEQREDLRVASTSSAARLVAREVDPDARTLDQQIAALERSPRSRVRSAVRSLSDDPAFTRQLSNDYNPTAGRAKATIGVVVHEQPGLETSGGGGGPGGSGANPLTSIQLRSQRVVDTVGGDITVFGSGVISEEFGTVIGDSILIVTPAAMVFIVVFLLFSYRDLIDLLLGVGTLVMALVWTFGFLGHAGIPFNNIMIAIPPLLLAVGIDFGIHTVNRYREERQREGVGIAEAMRLTRSQLVVAFAIVTGTTVIGFLANLASELPPIREFGLAAAVGIVFVFLLFGFFLPAAKVLVDRLRERYPIIPTMSQRPLGARGTSLGRVLQVGVAVSRRAPALLVIAVLLISGGAAVHATGLDTQFSQEDFLPPAETPDHLAALPEPFKPSDYTVVSQLNFLEDNFAQTQGSSVVVYVQGRMEDPTTLESMHRAGSDPPDTFVSTNRQAEASSPVSVIRDRADADPEFRRLVERNDRDGNGIPDRNLGEVYDALADSPARVDLRDHLAADRRSARVVYSVEADAGNDEATADGRAVADRYRQPAVATGGTVVFQAVSDLIFESAVLSLALALGGTALFLVFVYWLVEGLPSLGVANIVPIVVAVSLIAGTMRVLGIGFNAFTATILALTIGLGIDYSVHVVHRFADERRKRDLESALDRTIRGTGGALTGSMLTTVFGIGVLVLALLAPLGQFGILTALSVFYSFLTSVFVLPSVLVLWDRVINPGGADRPMDGTPAVDDSGPT